MLLNFYLLIFLIYFNKDCKYNLGFRVILDIKPPREFLYASVSDGKFYHITTSFKLWKISISYAYFYDYSWLTFSRPVLNIE